MEGQAKGETPLASQPAPAGGWWADLRLLLVLLAVAAALRGWHLWHTEVAARDSISYIRYAWQLRHFPRTDTLKDFEQPPGYTVAILAASVPVRQFSRLPDAVAMQLSAQLVSALAGLLLVVPMFYLGKEVFGRGVGFGAALLFQCLPASGRILTDALSEPTFLLLCATALWLAARALRTGSPLGFAAAGLFGALAYLTRPEGAFVVLATGLVLVGTQLAGPWRRPWRRAAACGLALAGAALAVGGPYAAVIGGFTNKQSVGQVIEGTSPGENERPTDAEVRPAGGPLFASTLGLFWPGPVEDRAGRV
ncbi:MAG TPA: glycosyltransferase family 39 protein, partial [Gemmataceae bacterium]|nr:glycosyltransferase family 39 protein [Gemmataceae bacterium]